MQQNFWRSIIKFNWISLFDLNNLIPLVLAIIGFIAIIFLRIPEKKTKTSISLSKFSFLLMHYLYLDAEYHDKLLLDAKKLEPENLYHFMIRELSKTKDSQEVNQKLLSLFQDFKLVDYCKTLYSKSSSDRKLKLMEDFTLLPLNEINDLLLPVLSGHSPISVKLAAIRTLVFHGLGENPHPILACLSLVPDSHNQEVSDILFRISQINPHDKIKEPSKLDPALKEILTKRFTDLLLQSNSKEAISGAYMLGYLCERSASTALVKSLVAREEKELKIAILIALRKLYDVETANDLIQFLIGCEKLDTDIIRECLTTLISYGPIGKRLIQTLETSSKPILKVMAKSFLNQA